jgi:hypothetical protein
MEPNRGERRLRRAVGRGPALIEDGLGVRADAEQGKKAGGRNKNLKVAECRCGEKIRLSASVLFKCAPMCQTCNWFFIAIS